MYLNEIGELFAIKSKEHWRSEINIDVQALEIVDGGPPTDLLSQDGFPTCVSSVH
ncbi:PAO [Symbiodinium pilosum]|uniref:PAO protein n=1 Tax=Symbiodinium pilosum TaxID=2952 RepID=A0A812QMA1_SYMPI|nr:PAO [Symbiodinium pilosum]